MIHVLVSTPKAWLVRHINLEFFVSGTVNCSLLADLNQLKWLRNYHMNSIRQIKGAPAPPRFQTLTTDQCQPIWLFYVRDRHSTHNSKAVLFHTPRQSTKASEVEMRKVSSWLVLWFSALEYFRRIRLTRRLGESHKESLKLVKTNK